MNLRTLLLSAFAVTLSMSACKQEDDPAPSPGIGGTMNAQIDGDVWASTQAGFNQVDAKTVEFYGSRTPSGPPTTIYIMVGSFNGNNEYTIGAGNNKGQFTNSGRYYTATSGTVKVTENDDTWFKATFSFTAKDSVNADVTNITGNFTFRKKV